MRSAGDVEQVYSFCVSQPCRFMRDFPPSRLQRRRAKQACVRRDLELGWWRPAADSSITVLRSRAPRIGSISAAGFRSGCFRSRTRCSPIRLQSATDGRLRRCLASSTCPNIFEVNSANRVLGEGRFAAAHRYAEEPSADPHECPFLLFSRVFRTARARPQASVSSRATPCRRTRAFARCLWRSISGPLAE